MRSFTKIYLLLILMGLILLSGSKLNSQLMYETLEKIDNPTLFDYKESYNRALEAAGGKKLPGWKQYKRWEYFWEPRVGEDGSFPDPQLIIDAHNYVTTLKDISKQGNRILAKKWNNLGPNLHTNIYGHGRVNVIRLNPNNDNELWAGSAGGGVWKSVNGGQTWINFPFTEILSIGVSDIAIAPTNPNIVYVATGDADGSGSTQFNTYSVGILKTTDGGNTWNTTGYSQEIERRGLVARILVHPNNENILIAGTSSGIHKSTDGGTTWYITYKSAYIKDMEFLPGKPDEIYASTYSRMGGASIYRSTDNGESWSLIESFPGANRIALGVTIANPNKVYALLSKSADNGFHSFRVLTSDLSNEFDVKAIYTNSNTPNILGWWSDGKGTGGQGFYDLAIAVNPRNENEIFTGGIHVWKSTNGGNNWFLNNQNIHVDHHDLIFNNDGSLFISANDGGLDRSSNKGLSWQSISRGLEITQFYRLGTSTISPALLYAGAQDNGTSRYLNGNWAFARGGDGMETIIDPTNDNRYYVSSQGGNLLRKRDNRNGFETMINTDTTKENAAWLTPYILDPNNPNILYAGYNNVWKHNNYGKETLTNFWSKISDFGTNNTLRSLAISPSDPNVIYAGTYTVLYATYNGGVSWKKILSSSSSITYVAVDPEDPRRIFVSKSGFNATNKVEEYDGENWSNLTGNLPNVPVNCIVYQKDSPDRLYIGTDIGVYYSDNGSAYWVPYGDDMPHVSVSELEINYSTRKLRASTYGRGIWETGLLECNDVALTINIIGDLEFCEGESVVLEADRDYPQYLWSTGETTKSITVSENGSFTLIIPESQECILKSKVVHVSVLQVSDLKINVMGNNPLCDGESVTLSASFGFEADSYEWSDGTKSRKLTTSEPGIYTVTAKTKDDCFAESEPYEVIGGTSPEKPTLTFSDDELHASEAASYKWYRNGTIIPGAVESVLKLVEKGIYEVEAYNETGCSTKSDPYNYKVSSVNNSDIRNISVHPNPFEGYFNIEMNLLQPGNLMISVSNMIGQQVISISETLTDGTYSKQIDLSSSPKGIYLLIIKYGDIQVIEKLINR